MKSKLPRDLLREIWNKCDPHGTRFITAEAFEYGFGMVRVSGFFSLPCSSARAEHELVVPLVSFPFVHVQLPCLCLLLMRPGCKESRQH